MIYRPLFILAPPRSFTSVTCAMIGNHPQMFGLAETNLFAADTIDDLLRLYRIRPRMQHGLVRSIAELAFSEQSEETVNVAKMWLEEHRTVATGDVFKDLCAWGAPRCLIDKSPIYVYSARSLSRIRNAFPDARYLHLLRHPRSTCESIYKMRQEVNERSQLARTLLERRRSRMLESNPEVELTPESMWLKPRLRILEHLEQIPSNCKMTLHGEELLSHPGLYLAQIAEWLGIRHDPPAIEAMMHPEQSPFASYGPNNARLGNDPGFMENPELRLFQAKPYNLEDPLSWNPELKFSELVRDYALLFNYG